MIKINVENNEKRQEIQAFVEENGGKVLPYQDKKISVNGPAVILVIID